MSEKIPFVSIIKRGSASYPRYVVAKANDFKNPVYWTGEDWSGDETAAVIFADINEALWVYHLILMENVSDRPCTSYIAPIHIDIYGPKPKLRDLKDWLEKTVRIVADVPKHGYGPGESVGVIVADFERTRVV